MPRPPCEQLKTCTIAAGGNPEQDLAGTPGAFLPTPVWDLRGEDWAPDLYSRRAEERRHTELLIVIN